MSGDRERARDCVEADHLIDRALKSGALRIVRERRALVTLIADALAAARAEGAIAQQDQAESLYEMSKRANRRWYDLVKRLLLRVEWITDVDYPGDHLMLALEQWFTAGIVPAGTLPGAYPGDNVARTELEAAGIDVDAACERLQTTIDREVARAAEPAREPGAVERDADAVRLLREICDNEEGGRLAIRLDRARAFLADLPSERMTPKLCDRCDEPDPEMLIGGATLCIECALTHIRDASPILTTLVHKAAFRALLSPLHRSKRGDCGWAALYLNPNGKRVDIADGETFELACAAALRALGVDAAPAVPEPGAERGGNG